MIKLLDVLLVQYADCDEINSPEYKAQHRCPFVELVPLPSGAQFLNVIESVFSGMARAIIHNSDYQTLDDAKTAVNRYFEERNAHFRQHPRRAERRSGARSVHPPLFPKQTIAR